jgi:hypothetical protein
MGLTLVDACALCINCKKFKRVEFHAALRLSYRNLEFGRCRAICVDSPRQVCSGFPVRAAEMQWAKWLAFQSKTSPARQSGSGGARPMLFASGEITAVLKFQRPKAASIPCPSQRGIKIKIINAGNALIITRFES